MESDEQLRLLLMLKGMSIRGALFALSVAALVQVLFGFPFLISYPFEYIPKSFDLGRALAMAHLVYL
jgi:alpha-1,3-mannosyltransferase